MADLTNNVNPLTWNVPIVDKLGRATPEFQRKWEQQARTNGTIPDLSTAAAVSEVLDVIGNTTGSLLVRGSSAWNIMVPSADGRVLRDRGAGQTPIWDTLSNVLDKIGLAQGDVLFRSATGWSALTPGTAGQVLTTHGNSANPTWENAASGGGAASAQDDGTNLYLAVSDANGQLVLDGSGNPVFVSEVLPAASLPAPAGYVSGSYGSMTVNKVKGVTDGSSAAAGDVGEEIKTVVPFASGATLTNNVVSNIGSLVLTPGDWDVSASAGFYASTTNTASVSFALSTVSAVLPVSTTDTSGISEISVALSVNVANIFPVPSMRFNVTVNTTVFLVVQGAWTGAGTPVGWGTVRARRMR
jgi:hypothetical protein